MSYIFSGITAILFAVVIGGTPLCGAVFFAALGLFCFQKIAGVRLSMHPYTLFVSLLLLGAAGDTAAYVFAEADGLSAAWAVFLPTIFFTFFTGGIRMAARKVILILYTCLVMLLHMYAAQGAESRGYCFLSMQLAGLFAAIYSLPIFQKRKNDA